MFQPGAMLYTQGYGSRPENVEVPFYASRAPASLDTNYPLGKRWIFVGDSEWILLALSTAGGVTSATWAQTTSASGDVISVLGTANQITVTTAAGVATVSLPSAITTPGSLTTTTSLASGTTMTVGTGLTVTSGGSTITAGDETLTAGNVIINGAAKQLRVHGGAVTDFIGTATLTNGTSGAIANTNIAAADRIFIQRTAANASTTLGELSYTISAGASFTITSLILGTPGSPQTGDASTVTYFIVRQV